MNNPKVESQINQKLFKRANKFLKSYIDEEVERILKQFLKIIDKVKLRVIFFTY